ncbi:hypothetical protein EYF80_063299 [Liparis tanakae]|uniref:Uncharacterized protein n=1 Tax=Liparis tanakae TaxID=230148 RepID=A0A4Z2ECV7_9TELE|nr:hypothetical protein EYF80_063299 [Liparis tanakae]
MSAVKESCVHGPSFSVDLLSDTSIVYPWETAKMECSLSVSGSSPKTRALAVGSGGFAVAERAVADSCTMGRNPPSASQLIGKIRMDEFAMGRKEGRKEGGEDRCRKHSSVFSGKEKQKCPGYSA